MSLPSSGAPSSPSWLQDLTAEVTGRRVRDDAVVAPSGGPAGNARLTAWTGVLLLALVLAELLTLFDVSGLINWHVSLGALLIPVALLKTTSTGWRILRYYTGNPAYRAAGPPPAALRVLGPLVVASTVGVLGSGVALVLLGPDRSRHTLFAAVGQRVDWVTVHQALFLAFAVLAGLHLLGRAVRVVELVSGRAHRAPGRPRRLPGRNRRATLFLVLLAAGAVAVALLLPLAGDWHDAHGPRPGPPGASTAVR